MESATAYTSVVGRIVGEYDLEDVTDLVLCSFAGPDDPVAGLPPRAELRGWVRWNVDLVLRWLVAGEPPDEADLDRVRELGRVCAAEGYGPDDILANYRRAARFAWAALLAAATEEERPSLLESAGLLFDFVDQVSLAFSDAYERAVHAGLPDPDEAMARQVVGRLEQGEPPTADDRLFARRVGVAVDGPLVPFVVVASDGGGGSGLSLAVRLRARGLLAAAYGRSTVGVAGRPVASRDLEAGAGAVVVVGDRAPLARMPQALQEARAVAEVAAARGHQGPVGPDQYQPEVLLHRSPETARRLVARVYGPLTDHPELAATLDRLLEYGFDRGATAAALPVHRNTLTHRLARIRDLTGVDIDDPEGMVVAWLAWRQRG